MSKLMKRLMTEELAQQFKDVDRLLVLGYQGISAQDSKELRRELKERGVEIRVIKNSAARLAFEKVGLGSAVPFIEGPSAVVWGGAGVIGLARAAWECARKYEPLNIRGGVAEDVLVTAEEVSGLAWYESDQALLAQVISCFEAPVRTIVGLFDAPTVQMVRLVAAIADKDEKSG